MSQLAKLQHDFQAYLMGDVKTTAFNSHIIDDAKVGASKRLGIYYNAYRFRIIEALATTYPKLHALLGDDLFDHTARSYIDQFPSTNRNMRWVGGHMQTHLQNTLPQHPIAAEMAQFEWALCLAFDAEEHPSLQLQDLTALAPETWADLCFNLQPCIQLCHFNKNAVAFWQALNAQDNPPQVLNETTDWLVWRQDLNAHFRSLSIEELNALQQLYRGETFGDLCAALEITYQDQASHHAAQFLLGWIEIGILKPLTH